MTIKLRLSLLIVLALFYSLAPSKGQERDDEIVKIRSRVVFIDTLVKDKKTGASVTDLKRENFEVRDDGKSRTLSYFSRAGEGHRRPLALLLVIEMGARDTNDYMRRAEVLESLGTALKRLPPEDEVAVMANVGGAGTPLRTLTDFTRDRTKTAEGLAAVRTLPMPQPTWYKDELANILAMAERAAAERPDSQIVVVPVTVVLMPISVADREKVTARLIRANAFFSPLIRDAGAASMKMSHLPGKYPAPPRAVLDAIGRLVGWDNYAPQHIAQQTGGEATSVHQRDDFGVALEKLIADLAARYNLGFTLNENERDDGRMHKLEVRVKARDSSGKERKLVVRARRGYYMKMQEVPVVK
ncbi:MAG TPA: VWA domain-containing protein [Pyrinomonadaceae bacterium]